MGTTQASGTIKEVASLGNPVEQRPVGRETRGIRAWDAVVSSALPEKYYDRFCPPYDASLGSNFLTMLRAAGSGATQTEVVANSGGNTVADKTTIRQQAWICLGVLLSDTHVRVIMAFVKALSRDELMSVSATPGSFLDFVEARPELVKRLDKRTLPSYTNTVLPAIKALERDSVTPDLPDLEDGLHQLAATEWSRLVSAFDPLSQPLALHAIGGGESWKAKLDEFEKTGDLELEARLEAELDAFVASENAAARHCGVEHCPNAYGKYEVSGAVRSSYAEDTRCLCIAHAQAAAFAKGLGLSFADFNRQEADAVSRGGLFRQGATMLQLLSLVTPCQAMFCTNMLPTCTVAGPEMRRFGGTVAVATYRCNSRAAAVFRTASKGRSLPYHLELPGLPTPLRRCSDCDQHLPIFRRKGEFTPVDETGRNALCVACVRKRVEARGGTYISTHRLARILPDSEGMLIWSDACARAEKERDGDSAALLIRLNKLVWTALAPSLAPLHIVLACLRRHTLRSLRLRVTLEAVRRFMGELPPLEEGQGAVNHGIELGSTSASPTAGPSASRASPAAGTSTSAPPADWRESAIYVYDSSDEEMPIVGKGKAPAHPVLRAMRGARRRPRSRSGSDCAQPRRDHAIAVINDSDSDGPPIRRPGPKRPRRILTASDSDG